jgi:glycosyltransferase involved in cell wall biosynthesis
MIFVSSDISWSGKPGNDTLSVVLDWKKKNDWMNKIHVIDISTRSQAEQYTVGMDYIRKNIPCCDWVQLVDSDEVWTESVWENAMDVLFNSQCLNSISANMDTYIKSQFYRIVGAGEVTPVVFVRSSMDYQGIRYNTVIPRAHIINPIFHFAMVRRSFEDIAEKIANSIIGDKDEYSSVNIDEWKRNVWDTLPSGSISHYIKGCENIWQGVVVVRPEQIPASCANIKI